LKLIVSFAVKFWSEMDGDASSVGEWRIFKSTTFSGGANWEVMLPKIY
jgi:hypothetical protein